MYRPILSKTAPLLVEKYVEGRKRKRRKRKNNAKFSGHYVRPRMNQLWPCAEFDQLQRQCSKRDRVRRNTICWIKPTKSDSMCAVLDHVQIEPCVLWRVWSCDHVQSLIVCSMGPCTDLYHAYNAMSHNTIHRSFWGQEHLFFWMGVREWRVPKDYLHFF